MSHHIWNEKETQLTDFFPLISSEQPNLATQCISNFISSRRGGSSIAYISNMASRFLPIEESDNPKKVSQKVENAEIKKKRKRCVSPKNSKRSRSRSPIGLKSCQDIHSSQKNDFDSPVVKVKIVSPTLRGVAESARLLRNGMFSFPTETMYSLVSFIHFRRRKDKECKTCHWESSKSYMVFCVDYFHPTITFLF